MKSVDLEQIRFDQSADLTSQICIEKGTQKYTVKNKGGSQIKRVSEPLLWYV